MHILGGVKKGGIQKIPWRGWGIGRLHKGYVVAIFLQEAVFITPGYQFL